jgi:hypothetical protein
MDLRTYIERLRQDLAMVAEAGGDEAWALAERLTAPLESAMRLALLDALSAAADEITRELAPGSVEIRLRGRDPEFVVTPPPFDRAEDDDGDDPHPGAEPVEAPAPDADDGDGGTARVTLRLPDHLKPRIDEAATRAGLSVNAWLVRAVAGALDAPARRPGPERRRGTSLGSRHTGWVS